MVIHLAAQAGVRYSLINPHLYVKSNLLGFGNILENSKKSKVRHLIYASSSSVYGERKKKPFSEKDPTDHPTQLYAATKRSNELMAHSYSYLFNIPTTGIRFFTVYGPWGRPDMALFKFTNNIFNNKKIQVFNYGKHSRDFTYIDDVTRGIMKCIYKIPKKKTKLRSLKNPSQSNAPFRIINIGKGCPVPLTTYIKLIEKNLGKNGRKVFFKKQKGDLKDTWSSIQTAKKILRYKPRIAPKEGIKKFVEWYRQYYKKY